MKFVRKLAGSAEFWIPLVLVLVTVAVFFQVRHFDFVNYDDPSYVSNNRHLRAGLSAPGIEWALTSGEDAYWFPLTRLSYLLDFSLFGLNAGGYHLTSLLFHLLASLLLFDFLFRATSRRWPSAFVAFVFALHPLHVESVAWIAERKDVLCAFFWFLALLAWVRYARRPSWRTYLLALVWFAMGLMAKPMIVTLPFVLLLLDAWPLRRPYSRKLLVEKLPFLALSAASAMVAYLTQRSNGAVQSLGRFPLGLRIENALVTWIVCIARMFWPGRLAVIYPYPKQLPLWQAAAAGLALAGISVLVLRCFRSRPYLAVGWFWFLGTLVPVIGLVQVGRAARADHFMYVPMVGLTIMLAWGVAEIVYSRPRWKPWVWALAAGALIAQLPVTWLQLRYWKNSESLLRHAIAVTDNNQEAYLQLGIALMRPGRYTEAITVFETGLRIDPNAKNFQTDIGATLLSRGDPADLPAAIDHLGIAVKTWPDDANAHSDLALAWLRMNRPADAIEEARAALRLDPGAVAAHTELSAALSATGRPEEAIDEARTVVRLEPRQADSHFVLGTALTAQPGHLDEAIEQFREALDIKPDFADAHYNLAVALAKVHGPSVEVLYEYQETLLFAPGYRSAHLNLAMALAQIPGRLPEAIAHLRAALQIQPDPALRKTLEEWEARRIRAGR